MRVTGQWSRVVKRETSLYIRYDLFMPVLQVVSEGRRIVSMNAGDVQVGSCRDEPVGIQVSS